MGMILNLEFFKNIKLPTKIKKTHASNICLYSPSSSIFYEYSHQTIKPVGVPAKDTEIISFIPLEDMIAETLDINKFLEGSDLYDAIELKLFDELALEPSLEYKICYAALPDNEESPETKKYNTYIATYQAIKQRLAGIGDKYTDFVFAPQTVIKTLFTKNFLSDSSTFAFIYLYNDSAFLCVYQNGRFTYSKSIRGSIRILTERFSEILGERIDIEDFIKIIVNADFRAKKPEYEVGFKSILSEFFTAISDVLVHAKRINQISGYEAIYIGTEHGNIADITTIAKEYFETPFRDFDFNLGLKTEGFADMLSKLMIFAYLHDINEYEHLNFSIFMRPPPLFKRPAGKFMGISTVALLVSFVYPLYNYTLASAYYGYQIKTLNSEFSALQTEKAGLENKLNSVKKTQSELLSKISSEEKQYGDTVHTLQELEKARNSTESITSAIIKLSDAVAVSRVTIRSFTVETDTNGTVAADKNSTLGIKGNTGIKIVCSAQKPSDITEFAKKYWLATKLKTNTDAIHKDEGSPRFIGELSISGWKR